MSFIKYCTQLKNILPAVMHANKKTAERHLTIQPSFVVCLSVVRFICRNAFGYIVLNIIVIERVVIVMETLWPKEIG